MQGSLPAGDMQPETRYANVGDSQVAYQVVGDGPMDLVYVTGHVSNIDMQWEFPPMARILERLASFSRLIVFDRRGVGVSDPVRLDALPTWEHWTEDLTAVLDAVGSERAAIFTRQDAALWGLFFAATYPARTTALALHNGYARSIADDDYPGMSLEVSDMTIEMVTGMWGTEELSLLAEPSFAEDPAALRWLAKFQRGAHTPSTLRAIQRYQQRIDVRGVLSTIQVPTLVLHQENGFLPPELGRYIADHVAGARFVMAPGTGVFLLGEGAQEALDVIEEFLTGVTPARPTNRVLATVLFTDIVGSTESAAELGDKRWTSRLDTHDKVSRSVLERFDGRYVNTTGDGILATFEVPSRAIRCALALVDELQGSGIGVRAGLNTGEIELRDGGDIGGIGVHIGARVSAAAGRREVLCSRTVRDLTAGSEFTFEDRGTHALKGVTDEWQLFRVAI